MPTRARMTSTSRPPRPGRGPRRRGLIPIALIVVGAWGRVGMGGGAIAPMVADKGHTSGGGRPKSRPRGLQMETEIRRFLWGVQLVGALFGVAVGLAAGDNGMIAGVLAAAVGGALATPFVARLWRGP